MLSINSQNNQNNQNNLNFKQISLIRLPKNAFSEPENYKKCLLEFAQGIDRAEGKLSGNNKVIFFIQQIFNSLFHKKQTSAISLLDFYDMPIKAKLENNYHSFALFTGNEYDTYQNIYYDNKKDASDYASSFVNKHINKRNMSFMKYAEYFVKYQSQYLSTIFQRAFENVKVNEFRIQRLDELKALKQQLGL